MHSCRLGTNLGNTSQLPSQLQLFRDAALGVHAVIDNALDNACTWLCSLAWMSKNALQVHPPRVHPPCFHQVPNRMQSRSSFLPYP